MSDSNPTLPPSDEGASMTDQHEDSTVRRIGGDEGRSDTSLREGDTDGGPGAFADPDYVESASDASDTADVDTSDERSVRTDEPATPAPGGVIAPGVGATTTSEAARE